ncbi:NAD(P)H-dependent oxidoreductase [Photobacterium galatheae]|uniref:Oxidoreductase n=1 Tax=Photobacterium galatheae TaxID=1654360 RepID=A0A066RT64_9GAMM|nr:NAD(P)H-dependent oxidoreductase [Photobacterium galatheae]KDM93549.1 oxidoreductase [Photobacterium galatheae]MCM0151373.1 NAD(P)H-dependent oxidoreductase [Photobacterium galatheae]
MSKNILLLNANPKTESFARLLADHYQIEARVRFDVRRFDLPEMAFQPSLDQGYDAIQPLEPCLQDFQQQLKWADHLVIVSPVWWGGLPAKFKGLIDRAILPGVAFQFEADNPEPVPLLQGKTARIMLTMDAPPEMLQVQAQPVLAQLDRFTLQFCGVAPAETTLLGSVILSTASEREEWIKTVKSLGAEGI